MSTSARAGPAAEAYMREALELAGRGLGQTSPNPAVGAVLVRGGEVVGRGFHTWAGVKHAEVLALEQAGERARGASLYINLEPCAHQGRTGPCADALVAAGVQRVVAALQDPDPRVSGEGFRRLRAAGVEVLLASEFAGHALRLNEAFIHSKRTARPLVTLKAALTLDGKIAAPGGAGWITSERARAHAQQLRHRADAILTGIGTVLADDCLLTDRTCCPRSRPLLRLVLDSGLRIPADSKMVSGCRSDLAVVATSAAPPERRRELEKRGVSVLAFDGPDGRTDLAGVIAWLGERSYQSLLIEAGGRVNRAALASGAVDKIFFYYAPKILGDPGSLPLAGGCGRPMSAVRLEDVQVHPLSGGEFAVEASVVKCSPESSKS